MGLLPWEKTITCPYNPAHQITVERIQTHLVKCRRNHPDTEIVICPYNASHHVPKAEEQYHCSVCPDRKIVELAKYSWALDTPGCHGDLDPPLPPVISNISRAEVQKIMTKDENWETEASIKESYNPSKKASSSQVLRYVQGATPSERKKFYASEKQRHELLKRTEEEKRMKEESRKAGEEATEEFITPKPSINISRPSQIYKVDTLRRPSNTGDVSGRDSLVRPGSMTRHGSVTSQLLAMVGDRDKRSKKRGSILMNNNLDIDSTVDLDTSRESNITSTTVDPLDQQLTRMVLEDRPSSQYLSLRRPSGLGSFMKKN